MLSVGSRFVSSPSCWFLILPMTSCLSFEVLSEVMCVYIAHLDVVVVVRMTWLVGRVIDVFLLVVFMVRLCWWIYGCTIGHFVAWVVTVLGSSEVSSGVHSPMWTVCCKVHFRKPMCWNAVSAIVCGMAGVLWAWELLWLPAASRYRFRHSANLRP